MHSSAPNKRPTDHRNGLADAPSLADGAKLLRRAREVLRIEAQAVAALGPRLDDNFVAACRLILGCRGRVVVSGIGKSGHIARKLAATLASTGTPSFFVHPAEASHGDLGMVTREDVFIAMSNSGTTEELLAIVPLIKRQGARLIAITGDPDSALAAHADVQLDAQVDTEACPLNLAPTASTTAALALGDALAVALLDARGFDRDDFARSHPGGALGRRLLMLVKDVMRTGDELPVVAPGTLLTDALLVMNGKRMAMAAVVDAERRLAGIFTDGDLRRLFARGQFNLAELTIDAVMTRTPRTVSAEALAVEALRIMEEHKIIQLIAMDTAGRVAGAIHLHDLIAAKLA